MKICEFDPFGKNLTREDAIKSLKLATKNSDDGEIFFEQRQTETITFDDSRVKSANFDTSEGMGMRSVCGEITGYAHSTDLSFSALSKMIPTLQKASQEKKCLLTEAPIKTKKNVYDPSNPISELTFSKKIKILQEIDDFTRSLDPNIKQVTATISASNQKILILRPDGSSSSDIRPMVRLNISILLESNGRRENGYTGTGGRDTLLSSNGKLITTPNKERTLGLCPALRILRDHIVLLQYTLDKLRYRLDRFSDLPTAAARQSCTAPKFQSDHGQDR